LAKIHMDSTQLRVGGTRTMTGTWMYGPPEEKGTPRSRRYDTWSMGCIILEFIIWLLYGYPELKRFNHAIERFYTKEDGNDTNNTQSPRVHPEVERWITHMYQDPRCGDKPNGTAIRSLLEFVQKRLLVVKTSLDPGEVEVGIVQVQHNVPDVTVSAPIEDLANDDLSSFGSPIQEHLKIGGASDSACRAHAAELYNAVHDICNRAIRQVLPVLPLFNQENTSRRYNGPRPKHGPSLTVPGKVPTPPTARSGIGASTQSPQSLQVNLGGSAAVLQHAHDVWIPP